MNAEKENDLHDGSGNITRDDYGPQCLVIPVIDDQPRQAQGADEMKQYMNHVRLRHRHS
jgi:hypothetical protein